MQQLLPTLDYWKSHESLGGNGSSRNLKKQLIAEFNALDIAGMPEVQRLNALVGKYVNLEYTLPERAARKNSFRRRQNISRQSA